MVQSMRKILTLLLFLLAAFPLSAQKLELRGHLDAEKLKSVQDQVTSLTAKPPEQLVLELSSSSGELLATLELAKALYELKVDGGTDIIVYVDDTALGPAAILPFLADQLWTSVFVAWGDVQLGAKDVLPTNVLRSRVESLAGNAALQQIAAEMVKVEDALVLNQNDLRERQLSAGSQGLQDFRKRFGIAVAQQVTSSGPAELATGREAELFEQLRKHIRFKPEGENRVGHIKIPKDSGISQGTFIYVKQALDYYKANKPAFIILELNTPGGEVFASQRISDALKEMDNNYGVPVVAFINNWAISAGAMLAYSCRFITIAKDASMGAAEPIMVGGGGEAQTASEKVNSALRADFGNRAGFFGRNSDLAEAMVDKDIILVWRFGKVVRLDKEEQIRTTGPNPDQVITQKGKLLTLNSEDMMKFGVADMRLDPKGLTLPSAIEREQGRWGLEREPLSTHPFFDDIPNAVVDAYYPDWKSRFFAFLAHPMVASFLFMGMMLGFYIEINSPGFGVPGSLGLGCLSLIILSSVAVEAATWLELIMVIAGLGLLGVEIFLLPGFGVAGVLGLVLCLGGLVAIMLPALGSVAYDLDTQTLNAAGEEFVLRLTWLSGAFILSLILIAMLARYMTTRLPALSPLISVGEQEGYVAGMKAEDFPELGAKGVVRGTLRPAGKIEIRDKLYDALADGEFIDVGTKIRVVQIKAGHIIVERLEDS